MFSLNVLGGASIEGPDGPLTGRAAQRHRLALLALLAATPRGGLTRDKLVAYLWPERDAERARHALSDSVYRINRALGEATVEAVGDELRLDAERLPSDLAAFEGALERGPAPRFLIRRASHFRAAYSVRPRAPNRGEETGKAPAARRRPGPSVESRRVKNRVHPAWRTRECPLGKGFQLISRRTPRSFSEFSAGFG